MKFTDEELSFLAHSLRASVRTLVKMLKEDSICIIDGRPVVQVDKQTFDEAIWFKTTCLSCLEKIKDSFSDESEKESSRALIKAIRDDMEIKENNLEDELALAREVALNSIRNDYDTGN